MHFYVQFWLDDSKDRQKSQRGRGGDEHRCLTSNQEVVLHVHFTFSFQNVVCQSGCRLNILESVCLPPHRQVCRGQVIKRPLLYRSSSEVEVCWIHCTAVTDSCLNVNSSAGWTNRERTMMSELLGIVGFDTGEVRLVVLEAFACRGQRVAADRISKSPHIDSVSSGFLCCKQDSWVTVTMTTGNTEHS